MQDYEFSRCGAFASIEQGMVERAVVQNELCPEQRLQNELHPNCPCGPLNDVSKVNLSEWYVGLM